jgi:hypothetical protein
MHGKTLLFIPASLLSCYTHAQPTQTNDPIQSLVGRLDLAKFQATFRGLT